MLLMIDNFDSFTYNLVHYFKMLHNEVKVVRNDAISLKEIKQLRPDYIALSPGPGNPSHAGICNDILKNISHQIPTLGICLGHQCIGESFGGKITHAKKIMHGKTSIIRHHRTGLFRFLPQDIQVTRYHSLAISRKHLPESLEVTAWTDDGEIMAIKHKTYPIEGVQFHPESILTNHGLDFLDGFIKQYQ